MFTAISSALPRNGLKDMPWFQHAVGVRERTENRRLKTDLDDIRHSLACQVASVATEVIACATCGWRNSQCKDNESKFDV